MKSFPYASRGDPVGKHFSAEWINAINALFRAAPTVASERSNGTPAPESALLKVGSEMSVAGFYRGVYSPRNDQANPATTALDETQWFDDDVGDCVIVNWDDAKTGAHGLSVDDVLPGVHRGYVEVETDVYLPAYHVGGVGGGSSVTRMKVASVPSGESYITAKTWDGTTLGDTAMRVIPVMGHAVNDVIYAAQSTNGTEVADTEWIEILIIQPTTDRYKVMQAIDTTGRLGMDWVRAH